MRAKDIRRCHRYFRKVWPRNPNATTLERRRYSRGRQRSSEGRIGNYYPASLHRSCRVGYRRHSSVNFEFTRPGLRSSCSGARRAVGRVGNVFGEDFTLNPSDGENHTPTQDKYPAAENIYVEERDLRAVCRLDNPMPYWVKTLNCSLQRSSLGTAQAVAASEPVPKLLIASASVS